MFKNVLPEVFKKKKETWVSLNIDLHRSESGYVNQNNWGGKKAFIRSHEY